MVRDTGAVVAVPRDCPDPMPIVPVERPPPPRAPARGLRRKGVTPPPALGQMVPGLGRGAVSEPDSSLHSGYRHYEAEAALCQTKGCSFFGSFENNSYCSKCFRESQRMLQPSKV